MKKHIIPAIVLILLLPVFASAGTLLVPGQFPTIQAGIDAAVNGDEVIISPGTYIGPGNRDIDFKGKAITVKSESGPKDTIIDCNGTFSETHRGFWFHCGERATSVIEGLTIKNGYVVDSDGGGIFCYGASPTVRDCIIMNNTAYSARAGLTAFGGGMCNRNRSYPIVTNCIFSNNRSDCGGAISNVIDVSLRISNSIFTGNSVQLGGGIFNTTNCSVTVTNSLFSGNQGGGGAAIYNSSSRICLINCTLVANSGYHAITIYSSSHVGKLIVSNSILWDGPPYLTKDSLANITFSDVRGGWVGAGNTSEDPHFVDISDGDYRLLENSPCINAGDPNYVMEPNETDLDGKSRVIDDRIDMGAYEFNHTPIACVLGDDQPIEAQGPFGAKVTLDGSCSSDADSTPGTNDDINDFKWYEIDPCDPTNEIYLGSGQVYDCNLSLGQHTIILEVTDKAGATDSNEITVTVQDTTPPELNLSVVPTILWPANHRMIKITSTCTATDLCDESPQVSLVDITMNEPGVADDIRIDADGSIYLCATRSGTAKSRIYTITYRACDDSGNCATRTANVTVPHDMRK